MLTCRYIALCLCAFGNEKTMSAYRDPNPIKIDLDVEWHLDGDEDDSPVYPCAIEFIDWSQLVGKKGRLTFEESLDED